MDEFEEDERKSDSPGPGKCVGGVLEKCRLPVVEVNLLFARTARERREGARRRAVDGMMDSRAASAGIMDVAMVEKAFAVRREGLASWRIKERE